MPKPKEDKILAVRRRLLEDFPFYAEHCLKLRTKEGAIAPFSLNKAQRILVDAIEKQWAAEGKVRIIVLKARQQGISTCIGGWLFWYVSQHPAQRALIATHSSDSSRALFDLTRRYFDNIPEIMRPATKYASRRELFFSKLDSSYIVATAGSESIGRGETLTSCHLSELGFWSPSSARETFNGIMQAVPSSKGSAVFIESTGNGVSGLFWDTWQSAVRGENNFVPIFIPWHISDEYRIPAPEHFERSPEEEKLVAEYDLDNDQLQFRRLKIAENGRDLFAQEFPITAEEAFLTSGRPVFVTAQLQERLAEIGTEAAPTKLLRRMALEGTEWKEHPRGELRVYEELSYDESYTIGADTSAGIRGRDFSVAQVLDRKKRQVAMLRGYFQPDYFADLLHALGTYYNMALVAPESNNHGVLTVNRLQKDLAYPYVFTQVVVDKQSDEDTVRIGFATNTKTKPLIIDKLRAEIRDGEITLNDPTTVNEMLTYVVKENGAMEAEASCKDDCVMALAIANYCHEGSYEPVPNDESFYVNMV